MKILTLACLMLAVPAAVQAAEPTTIILVRHAEKVVEPKNDDPGLTPAGAKRAEALARMLRDAGVKAIYATEYKRTQLTVAPLAKVLGLKTEILSSKDSKAFATQLLRRSAGSTAVVAGHSNTVPEIIAGLGVKDPPAIDDADYDNLFVVVRREGQPAQLIRLHFPD